MRARSKSIRPFILIATILPLTSCEKLRLIKEMREQTQGAGGGHDAISADLPFTAGYETKCVQGVAGDYSHSYTSTYWDLDFDTPNDRDDMMYAPITGTAYVHDDPADVFGLHVNIDVGDGTYIVLAHLSDIIVADAQEVAAGVPIGFEGTTGASTGDHVHMGRHDGDAWNPAAEGISVEGLMLAVASEGGYGSTHLLTQEFDCDLSYGEVYTSVLQTPMWHPSGTLIMTPTSSTVYLLEGGSRHAFIDEGSFWSRGYSFDDVVLVDDEELDCYDSGASISSEASIQAVYDGDEAIWLLMQEDGVTTRHELAPYGWQSVLRSWGIIAWEVDDLSTVDDLGVNIYDYPEGERARFRDGSLISEIGNSAVYAIADGIAMPIIDWDTFLLLGFDGREIIEVEDGLLHDVQGSVGSCSADSYCITSSDVTTCGGGEETVVGESGGEADSSSDEEPDDVADETATETGEEDASSDDTSAIDDLGEGLSWIFVDSNRLGLAIGAVFSDDIDSDEIVATGSGIDGSWGYSASNTVSYDEVHDIGWFTFENGMYRMTYRTPDQWAMYHDLCADGRTNSILCHENSDGSYALCFEVEGGAITAASTSDCSALE